MKIKGVIQTFHNQAECITKSVATDNLSEMETHDEGNVVITRICRSKIRSVIASMDDYLMNITVAEEVCEKPAQMIHVSGKQGEKPDNA